jgi:glycosyltransferase involved in cell wall biosynthesis
MGPFGPRRREPLFRGPGRQIRPEGRQSVRPSVCPARPPRGRSGTIGPLARMGRARTAESGVRVAFQPLPPGLERPRWSVMIPTHNCASFLRATLESVLAQDLGPQAMQIQVVDDDSGDDPASIVEEVGRGRIGFFSQLTNQGQIRNLATCVERSLGEIVHILHGDDYVLPGYYKALERGFASSESVGAAFCRWKIVDGENRDITVAAPEQSRAGIMNDALTRLASEQRVVTPSISVRREVWERLGGFDSRLQCAEDWEMWVRIAAHYDIWYEPQLLAAYRRHDQSNTGRNTRNAEELRYSRMAIEMFAPLLPREQAPRIVKTAKRAYASTALRNAEIFAQRADWSAVKANLLMAARLDPRPATLRKAAGVLLRKTRA